MDITEVSLIHHIALVLLLLWFLISRGWSNPAIYFLSLLYLYAVNERCSSKSRRKLQFEERKYAHQRRLLSDSESVRWLNHAVEKIWPICMEQIASQQVLLPIIPWFLDKYKPWTAERAVVQHLYLGRNPPTFTEMRVLRESNDDDHLVLELGMNFLSADDMSVILAVQLRKSVGFGIWANMHVTGMHVEGKVLVGVKFLHQWPFLGRLRICFVEPPYFQMTVKPIIGRGVDVTELPGIAGWLDKLLADAFEQTLVEPNMLVVDMEKFVSSEKGDWFTVDEKPPIAYVKLEIIEAADMKPSDLNGLADPYVRAQLGSYRFQTKIQRKTLSPRWLEEFKISIFTWEAPNLLVLQVCDKDHIFDDMLGDCSININDLRGGQRHDKWLPLRNIKTGRLHLAITVLEGEDEKVKEHLSDCDELTKIPETTVPLPTTQNCSTDVPLDGKKMADEYEPISIPGQEKIGIWVHHPGSDVTQTWEPRKGCVPRPEIQLLGEDAEFIGSPKSAVSGSNYSDGNISEEDGKHVHRIKTLGRGLRKFGSYVHRSLKKESPSMDEEEAVPLRRSPNIQAVGEKGRAVKLVLDDSGTGNGEDQMIDKGSSSPEKDGVENPEKSQFRTKAKNMVKQASKSAHNIKSALKRRVSAKRKEDEASDMTARDDSFGSSLSNDSLKNDPSVLHSEVVSKSEQDKEPNAPGEEGIAPTRHVPLKEMRE